MEIYKIFFSIKSKKVNFERNLDPQLRNLVEALIDNNPFYKRNPLMIKKVTGVDRISWEFYLTS